MSTTFLVALPCRFRVIVSAVLTSFSLARYVWPKAWGPSYAHSYAICISTNGLCIIMCYIFKKHLEKLNRDIEKKEQEEGRPVGFRYIP